MRTVKVNGKSLTIDDLYDIAFKGIGVEITPEAIQVMQKSRTCIENLIKGNKIVYGINTGFGKLSDVHIPNNKIEELQLNLILSHACGIGREIAKEIVRAIIALKINSLCLGYSGARPLIAELLLQMLNKNVIPCIPEKGSVGASGDLAPLAHLTLVMLGLGEAWVKGERKYGLEALLQANLKPVKLAAKEGLSLINGTQVMTAFAAIALKRALNLVKLADIAGALSVESLLGTKVAFDRRIQIARGFAEQIKVGENLQKLMAESEVVESHKDCGKIQDAYSSRCIPQVHSSVRMALEFDQKIISTEINACTDNPLVFWQDDEVLSGGNFHGQPISLACDVLSVAIAQLANISERRLENLMDPVQSGLTAFLTTESGTNSGFMIAQVTAAALVSENKVLSHPASVDSIPTSANQEDYVSMGTYAARKALEIVDNAETVIGIELLAGCQALDLRGNLKPGIGTGIAYQTIREQIPPLNRDRILHNDIIKIKELIHSNSIVENVETKIGNL